jgi:riboflavin biosynthesis pyrimidine reductase
LKVIKHLPIHREVEISSLVDGSAFYPRITGLRFNYVIRVGNSNPDSSKLTSESDRFFLKVIRSQSDLIVSTGSTARNESLKASKYAPLLLLTNQDQLDCPATRDPSEQKVYVTVDNQMFTNTNAVSIGETEQPLRTWLRSFTAEHNFSNIVIETGLTVTKELLASGTASEFCLSVTGANSSSDAASNAMDFLSELGTRPELIQLLEVEGTYLFRFDLTRQNQQ